MNFWGMVFIVLATLVSASCADQDSSQADPASDASVSDQGQDMGIDQAPDLAPSIEVEFQSESLTMAVGARLRPKVMVDGYPVRARQDYEIRSSDEDLVEPDGKFATALAVGNTTLTVEIEGQIATVSVEVVPGSFKAVSTGLKSTCALAADHTAWCWGYAGDKGMPQQIRADGAALEFSKLVVVDRAACGLTLDSATVMCWGVNLTPLVPARTSAPSATTFPSAVSDIAAGEGHVCALLGDRTVSCIGDNDRRQLGGGANSSGRSQPSTEEFVSIHAGLLTTCAVSETNKATCWGVNWGAMIADTGYYTNAIQLESPHTAVSVYPGARNLCWLTPAGEVKCRGYNWIGLAGETDLDQFDTHTTSFDDVMQASHKHETLCVVHNSGELSCRGTNSTATVPGLSEQDIEPYPLTAEGLWQSVSMGRNHGCAISLDGEVYCWGQNIGGAVMPRGYGDIALTAVPKLDNAAQVNLYSDHMCWTDPGGVPFCSGLNESGQLGTGNFKSSALGVSPVLRRVDDIGVGSDHTCALNGGNVQCWGDNQMGQLGYIPTGADYWLPSANPIPISLPENVAKLAVGANHACAVSEGSKLYCWGDNRFGQSSPDTATSIVPTEYAGAQQEFADVAVGSRYTCGLTTGGQLWCWGLLNNRYRAAARMLDSVRSVRVDSFHTCAITEDDAAHCWGFVPGHGTYSLPTQVETNVADAFPTAFATCYRYLDDSVACEGGGAGLMFKDERLQPELIVGLELSGWVEIVAGVLCAQTPDGAKCLGGDPGGWLFDAEVLRHEPTFIDPREVAE